MASQFAPVGNGVTRFVFSQNSPYVSNVDGGFAEFSSPAAAEFEAVDAGEQFLTEWPWDTADISAGLAYLIPSLRLLCSSDDSLGTVRLRIGGTEGGVDGTLLATIVAASTAIASRVVVGGSVAKPASGATTVKITGQPTSDGHNVTVKGVHLKIAGSLG